MTERDKIFGRIREGLRAKANPPGHAAEPARSSSAVPNGAPPSAQAREWLPRVGPSLPERLGLFQKTAEDLKAVVVVLESQAQLGDTLNQLRTAEGWKKIAAHRGALVDAAVDALALPVCRTDEGYNVRDLESSDVGITECDALVAQTGSVVVTTRSAGGRALSVLPPHHVVLARKEQLVPDLPEAFELLKKAYAPNYPSFISFITGPSRTGDIERILVLGAHGPKKLTIVLC
jgi:L-lactate dehydrogenase complex protein LldG